MVLRDNKKERANVIKLDSENEKFRKEFLFKMYDQMFNDINTHILVIWQSIGVLVGSISIFALVEKQVLPIDYAISIVIILIGWSFSHIYDSAYWYNRNLVIIANIERQFLSKDDLHNIHYYFGKHRKPNKMIQHLRIQWWLGIFMGIVFLIYHFISRIYRRKLFELLKSEPAVFLPYIILICVFIFVMATRKNRKKSYKEFLENSPGKKIDVDGIEFGIGHPIDTNNK